MAGVVFPTNTVELTPALLTQALSELQPGVMVESVEVVEEAHCDTGSASTAARAVLDLGYAAGSDLGLPGRVVLKTVLIRPGAPASMYQNEVRFYRDLRPELDIETPEVYASMFDQASGTFGVIMQDVRLRSARFPNATSSMSHQEVTSALDQLASLHASFWQSPRFSQDLRWLWTPCSGGFYDFLQSTGFEFIQQMIAQSEYKQELLVRLGRSFDEVWDSVWQAQAILNTQPYTLLHGDTHLGNTYLLPGGRAGLLDWQLMHRGRWAHDVTYLLVTSLDSEYRRKHERELLAYYLEQLREHGLKTPPTSEDAWLLYRQTAIWGFLIGWMICPLENYGAEIMQANLERLTAALEDLDTFAVLGSGPPPQRDSSSIRATAKPSPGS